jgi:hypothetical protein
MGPTVPVLDGVITSDDLGYPVGRDDRRVGAPEQPRDPGVVVEVRMGDDDAAERKPGGVHSCADLVGVRDSQLAIDHDHPGGPMDDV